MKRVLLITIVFLLAGTVYAQQTGTRTTQTSAQIKQEARDFSTQSRTRSSQFQTDLADLTAMNTSNSDLRTYNRLKLEISELESRIDRSRTRVRASLERGQRVYREDLNHIDSLIKQHQDKLTELDAFVSQS